MPNVNMPKFDDEMEEGTLYRWLKSEGEWISEGDEIAEIHYTERGRQGDEGLEPIQVGTYYMLRAENTGTLTRTLAVEGQDVPVGHAIAVIENVDSDEEAMAEGTEQKRKRDSLLEALRKRPPAAQIGEWPPSESEQHEVARNITQGTTTATRRLNVVFSESAYEDLKKLADQSGKTISDVVRDAIALQKWFNDVKRGGGRILVEERGRVREILNIR